MTMSKGAIGNLISRYRAVLKKCRLINTFGSLAVAGMLVMGGAGAAGAVERGSIANESLVIHEDTTVTASETAGPAGGIAGIVAESGDMSVTVDAGKKLTVTGNTGNNASLVYGAYTAAGTTLELSGDMDFSLSSPDKPISVFQASGNMTIDGNIKAVANGGSRGEDDEPLVVGVEALNGAHVTFAGEQTSLEANSTGGRIIGVQNYYKGDDTPTTIDFNADKTIIHIKNNADSPNFTQAVRAYQSTTNFTGNVDINVVGGKEKDTYGVDVQGDPGKLDTAANFSGDTTTIDVTGTANVYAVRPSGVPTSINFTGKTVDIKATSLEGGAAGIWSQYGAHLTAKADVDITVKATEAYGVMVTDYAKYAGNAEFEGNLKVSASSTGSSSFGLYNSGIPGEKFVAAGEAENGKLFVTGTTDVSSSSEQSSAFGLYAVGKYAKTRLTGDITIDASAQAGASYGVVADENARVTLGSEGKNINLTAASSGGVSQTVAAFGGSEITFAGARTTIRNTSTTTAKNYGVYLDSSKAAFGADSTTIEVTGVGSSGTWGYGVDLWNGSAMSFTGKDVSISDYQQAYTAQTITVRDTSTLAFSNAGNVDIGAKSPYGVTAVVVKSGDKAQATFDNGGNVTITSALEDPAQFAGTNVIGLLVEQGTASFTEKVNQVNVKISGQGCDYDGSSYSDGTAAIFVQNPQAKVDVKAKELNIDVSAEVDPGLTVADQKKYDDAYGIRASAGTVSIGNATKTAITVNESRGTAYGVVSTGADSSIRIEGDASINTTGKTNAYGLYAADSGSIVFGGEGTVGHLTSSGTGIFVDADASVALNGDTSITAAKVLEGTGAMSNAGALTLMGDAADFTGTFTQSSGSTNLSGTFFGGDVKLGGGTMNVAAASPGAGKTVSVAGQDTVLTAQSLDLRSGNVTVSDSGSVVVAEGGFTTFGNGKLTIDGGSVTADAGNFISDAYAALTDAAASIVGTAGDLYLRLTQGTEYTATEYNDAKAGLFESEGEKAQLTFLNGTLRVEAGEQVIIGGSENNGNVTLSGVTPVVAKENEAAQDTGAKVASVPDQYVRVVKADDINKNLLSVNTLEVADSQFSAKGLQVNPKNPAQGVALTLTDGSDITLIGGENTGSGVIVDENQNAVKTSAIIDGGSSLNLGMEGNTGNQMGTLEEVDVMDGTLNVNGNGLATTQYTYGTLALSDEKAEGNLSNASVSAQETILSKGELNVQKGADARFGTLNAAGGTLNVLGSTASIETLDASRGTVFVDPAYLKIDTLSGDSFGIALLVSDGSVVEIGSVAELQAKAAEAGLNPAATASGKGFTVASGESMLALGKAVTLGAGGRIVVDAGVNAQGEVNGVPVSDAAYFGGGSLLVVDSAVAAGKGALVGNGGAITVKEGAKLYITDATVGSTYTVASGFADASSTVAGWTGADLITNRLIDAERIAGTDGSVIVRAAAKQAASLYPNLSVPNTLDAMIGNAQNDVDSASAGIAFLSRALEPQFLAEGDVVPTIDGAAQLAYAGGVQASTMAVAQAPARAVQNHLSLASNVAQPGTSLHEDGFDLWAQAIYGANRARDFSAGSLDAGYNSDFGGAVIGGDWTFGAGAGKARVGLAFNVGAGETKSRGDFNGTKNEFDFWGVSLYGGWNLDNVNVIADLGYSASKNELKQDIPSSLGLGSRIKGDVDSSVITAGLKGEYMIKTDVLDVMPHVGVRYMAVKTDSFTTKLDQGGDLFETDSDLQHVWQFPVGVSLSKSIETESGWKVKPQADLSVVPAAGDTKYAVDVRTPGVNASDSMKRRVMDTTAFDGVFGVEVQKDNVSFGLSYNVQASEHETGQGVTASFMYKF